MVCLEGCKLSLKRSTQLSMDIQTCIGAGVERTMTSIQGNLLYFPFIKLELFSHITRGGT